MTSRLLCFVWCFCCDDVVQLFSQAGLVRRVVMGLNKHTREPCGFAFVEFYHAYEAQNAIILVNGASCDGRVVRVDADSGESIEDDRKFGRGFTGRQWRDEYREEYDIGRGGEGKKKRSRNEMEEISFDSRRQHEQQQQQQQAFFGHQSPASVFPAVATGGSFCIVPPPPPPGAAEASAVAAAAALDAAVAEEAAAYVWQRNTRARRQLHSSTGPPPPAYPVFPPPLTQPPPHQPPNSALHASSNVYLTHTNYIDIVQRAAQQQQQPPSINPFGSTGSGAASFMRSSRGLRNTGRHHQRPSRGRT